MINPQSKKDMRDHISSNIIKRMVASLLELPKRNTTVRDRSREERKRFSLSKSVCMLINYPVIE
jgi:hypothetical protein